MYGNASSFHLDNVICTGNEASLLDCTAVGENNCNTSEVAGVKCGGKNIVKLQDNLYIHTYMKELAYSSYAKS